MKIAQVAPLYESVPPKLYGGTERVVSYLTEELVRQGHQVTLFASGDSVTQARLVAACPHSLFPTMPVVSISDAQRAPLPWINWLGTVYHGLPEDLYTFRETPGTYLAFLGRIAPEKGVEQAIAIAQQVGIPLKIAAKVARDDRAYYCEVVQPLLQKNSLVEYIGEVGGDNKDAFLGEAYALLFPIDWPEPFGLVMIEAMACGTPVIAYRRGSVPEVLADGVTGWIVEDMEEAVQAVGRVPALSRVHCRQMFEERFSATRMAHDYLRIYKRLLAERSGRAATRTPAGEGEKYASAGVHF
jgi:glycosyltransferase involved in cell wall biosynthesis